MLRTLHPAVYWHTLSLLLKSFTKHTKNPVKSFLSCNLPTLLFSSLLLLC